MRVINVFIVLFILVGMSWQAHAERWIVATLEWPPYICSRCPENGAAAKALKKTLQEVGVNVEFVFYSWTQAIKKGAEHRMTGYFPAWRDEIREDFTASPPLFRSPLGLIQPRDKPLVWFKLEDLKGKTIGVTEGYGSTEEFLRLVKKKVIRVESVKSDDTSLRNVALGKVDGALMDVNNARYLITVIQPQLAGRVSINSRILSDKELFFAFNSASRQKKELLKRALKQVDFQREVDEYLMKYLRQGN